MQKKLILFLPFFIILQSCVFFHGARNIENADRQFYETIGVEFGEYVEGDEILLEELKANYLQQLNFWKNNPSTRLTFDTISQQYLLYVELDPSFEAFDRQVRQDNVIAWDLYLNEKENR